MTKKSTYIALGCGCLLMLSAAMAVGAWFVYFRYASVSAPSARPNAARPNSNIHVELGPLHVEKVRGFAFSPPADWNARAIPGFKYEFIIGPVVAKFAPNINVIDEASALSMDEYVRASLRSLNAMAADFVKLDQSEFETDSGIKGIRMVYSMTQSRRDLRIVQYYFPDGKAQKLVVTCAAPAEAADSLDAVFDASMRTFVIQKAK